jgi:hypothetical protein
VTHRIVLAGVSFVSYCRGMYCSSNRCDVDVKYGQGKESDIRFLNIMRQLSKKRSTWNWNHVSTKQRRRIVFAVNDIRGLARVNSAPGEQKKRD